jgi:membrane fusion protein (multidrug efflux system)
MAELFLGSAVRPGDILGVIVPPGTLGVIATFPPSALSHMQPGLPARLRVDSTVGVVHSVPATVTQVVQDSQTRQVRVRLALTSSQDSTVLQHGLSGSVDVAVEQVTPATLVLRAIGQMTASI